MTLPFVIFGIIGLCIFYSLSGLLFTVVCEQVGILPPFYENDGWRVFVCVVIWPIILLISIKCIPNFCIRLFLSARAIIIEQLKSGKSDNEDLEQLLSEINKL